MLLSSVANYKFETTIASLGRPNIERFRLDIEPPWHNPDPSEIVHYQLTSAGVLALMHHGQNQAGVLLVQNKTRDGQMHWDIPAGAAESTDENIKQTARREFKEETGMDITSEDMFIPMAYAVHFGSYSENGLQKAGIQYAAFLKRQLSFLRTDDKGRGYLMPPLAAVESGEILDMVVEPLDLFMDAEQSLLSTARYPWSTVRLRGSMFEKFKLMLEAKQVN